MGFSVQSFFLGGSAWLLLKYFIIALFLLGE
jgi:hypothetical protein